MAAPTPLTVGRLLRAVVWCAVLLLGGTVLPARAAGATNGFVFTLEAAADRDQVVEVFYEFGTGWRQESSARRDLPGDGAWHRLEFPIPAVPLQQLRIDPGWGGATLRFRAASLAERNGPVLKTWSPPPLRIMQQVASAEVHDGVLTLVHAAGTDDPITLFDEPLYPLVQPRLAAHGWPHWAAPALALGTGLLLLCVLGATLWFAAGEDRRRTALQLALGIFLVVFGLRAGWVAQFGSPVPFNDEWDSEARVALRSWTQGTLDWSTLAAPHNEHRLVLSRLLAIGGAALRGEWDPRTGMYAAAALAAWLAALAAVLVTRTLRESPGAAMLVIAALVALQALPSDPFNLLWGGQIQMSLLLALAAATLALAAAPERARSACGNAALLSGAVLSLGSMGSGFVAAGLAAGVAAFVAVEAHTDTRFRGRALLPAGALAAIAVAGLLWRADAPHHHALHADTPAEWLATFTHVAAWPGRSWYFAALLWLPWLALGGLMLRRRTRRDGPAWTVLALGAWLLVQAAALAYARGRGNAPEPRHFTVLLLSPIVAALAGAALAAAIRSGRRRWAMLLPAVALPLGVAVATTSGAWEAMAATRAQRDAQAEMVREFLHSHDLRVLTNNPRGPAPYQQPVDLAALLNEAALRPYLPATLREAPGAPRPAGRAWVLFAVAALGAGLGIRGALRHFRRSPPG